MNKDEFFKIIGILIVSFFIIYFIVKMFKLQASVIEGLTNGSDTPDSGEAGTAVSYAAGIKAQVVKLQDELLIAKYRKDYETAIINLDDYIGYLMIKQVLNMKISDNLQSNIDLINNLNSLKEAKDSLNTTMTFLDKQ
uniref:Uncharacterized protein n=1 Tax=viral metagenome TaxID=1070528 RepID=A0A6C0KP90_9ZZZZ